MRKSLNGISVQFDNVMTWADCDNINDIQSLKAATDVVKHKVINYVTTELNIALSEFIKNELKNID